MQATNLAPYPLDEYNMKQQIDKASIIVIILRIQKGES